jgi:adenylate cyclase
VNDQARQNFTNPGLGWFFLTLFGVLAINIVAGITTRMTIDLMRNVTPFALAVFEHNKEWLPYWRMFAYGTITPLVVLYLWPLVRYFRSGCPKPVPLVVQRRAISFPTVVGFSGWAAWAASSFFFPAVTFAHFGTWTTELMSQQILSPQVNGFFAATSAYLFSDWIARCSVIPAVFPDGRTSGVPGAFTLGVRGRLFVFLAAVAFAPLFTMLGLVRAARVRFDAGYDVANLVTHLDTGSTGVFLVFMAAGLVLTVLLAGSFTRPLANVAEALRRIQSGDLNASVPVDSGDELGLLEEGVNDMAASLRERERILTAFGRAVEPAVRDRLLSGDLALGGEVRSATVMFCDLRGFTSFAERTSPNEVVATLNEFFTTVTSLVRECGGFVDKFIGDAVLVVFGLFEQGERAAGAANGDDRVVAAEGRAGNGSGDAHACNGDARGDDCAAADGDAGARIAIDCALGVRRRLIELNRARASAGKPELRIAMAIHTGEVLAGTIGALDRHEYTVIGDTVNVAARLQQVCKENGHDLVVSRESFERAARGGGELAVAAQESALLRGKAEPVSYLALA